MKIIREGRAKLNALNNSGLSINTSTLSTHPKQSALSNYSRASPKTMSALGRT